MMDDMQVKPIAEKLLAYADTIAANVLLPTVVPQAAPLVANDPYAFAIGVCLDRGTKAEIIWTIPYYIKEDLGHLDPHQIYKMSLDELASLFERLPQRPRYVNAAPRTIQDLTRIVVEECGGDAFNLWKDKRAADVNRTLVSIHGVGPGIANMGVLLIEKAFGVHFNDLDRARMDIKADVHTVRVLYRLGISKNETTEAALDAARLLKPDFPGIVDGALWDLGRRYCFSSNPNCMECPMNELCAHRM